MNAAPKPAKHLSRAMLLLPIGLTAVLGLGYWFAPDLSVPRTPPPIRLTFGPTGRNLIGDEVRKEHKDVRVQVAYVQWSGSDELSQSPRVSHKIDSIDKAPWMGPGKDRLCAAIRSIGLGGSTLRVFNIVDKPVRAGSAFEFIIRPKSTTLGPGGIRRQRLEQVNFGFEFFEAKGIMGERRSSKTLFLSDGKFVPIDQEAPPQETPVRCLGYATISVSPRNLEGKSGAVIVAFYRDRAPRTTG